MNRTRSILLSLIILISINLNAQDWKNYTFPEHKFLVNFVEQPNLSLDTSIVADTMMLTYMWSVDVADTLHENIFYEVLKVNYPPEYIHSDSTFDLVEGFLNSSQMDIYEDKTNELISERVIERNGYPGKLYRWKVRDSDVYFEYRSFLVNSTLWQLSLVTRSGPTNKSVDYFFDSFQLMNTPHGSFSLNFDNLPKTYSINFPGTPELKQNLLSTEYGKLVMSTESLDTEGKNDKNIAYISMQVKYPEGTIDESSSYSLNKFYKNYIERSSNSANGELMSISDINYKGRLGKQYKMYVNGGKHMLIYNIFLYNSYFYSYGVVITPENDNNEDMIKFFKSFKIL